ncbi:Isochorismatase family protein family, partial [Rasamsonia emersonii CBS 393.64]
MSATALPSSLLRGPSIQTRKALLLLDLQNDFVRPSGRLPVQNTQDFIDLIPTLVQSFRRTGDVVWVRTQYEDSRPLVDPDSGGERIVLDAGPLDSKKDKKKAGRDRQETENEDDTDPEAFLSGPDPACRAQTSGAQFPAPIVAAVDPENDIVIVKSDYSALQSPGLVLSLRSRFVTELYLCGSLSNVSVYATALDAARQGFSLTLVEDCLGFRSFARHEEAIRRMADIMGANGISVQELLEEQEWQETHDIAHASSPGQDQEKAQRPGRSHPRLGSRATTSAGIEGVMDHLAVKGSPPPNPPQPRDPARLRHVESLSAAATVIEADPDLDADGSDKEPWLLPPSKYPRSSTRPSRETHPGGTVYRPVTRVRRPRRPADSPPSARRPGSSRAAESNSGRTSSTSPVLTTTTAPTAAPSTPPPTASTTTTTTTTTPKTTKNKKKTEADGMLGPGDHIGEGDSRIIYNVDLPPDAFPNIRQEVQWQKMYHLSGQVPRLVAVQGAVLPDGSIPIYRHPADESPPLLPFTPTVDRIRQVVEGILGHSLNHVLIQLYRSGQDRISEHSDKTLDIVRGTSICNVSLGAQRTMILRTKASGTETAEDDSSSGAGRQTQRIPMPHNSVFVLGPKTNMRWLHGIRADKRPDEAKSAEERAFNGERISLTFRSIGTFIHPTKQTIWGQGAVAKTEGAARPVIHGDAAETERLIQAFGRENRDTDFDWDAVYGGGFDVVNFVTPAVARLVLSGDPVADMRVQLALTENGMRYETEGPSSTGQLVYVSPDGKTTVTGDIDILSYLAQLNESPRPGVDILRGGSQLEQIAELTASWRRCRGNVKDFSDLALWEQMLQEQEQSHGHHYISGAAFGVDDCALWPLLRDMQQHKASILSSTEYPHLWNYYHRV